MIPPIAKFDEAKGGPRWVSYFDMLAFSKFCEKAGCGGEIANAVGVRLFVHCSKGKTIQADWLNE